jgi:gelsolin
MDNYGGKEHKDAKLAAAKTEPAWEGAGKTPGIEVWRIEKFKVVRQDKKTYGSFFRGDSYIVLNTYKPDPAADKLAYNVHFWLGKETTQDEAGTAAYKTVELDDLLGDLPVQYREVDGSESDLFLDLFKGEINVLDGGVESGFTKVKPTEYKPRLFHIKGKKKVRVTQVPTELKSLNQGDTFLLDLGLELIQWNAPKAGIFEKRKGNDLIQSIKSERNGKPSSRVLDGLEDDAAFWKTLGCEKPTMDQLAPETSDNVTVDAKKVMVEVSDKTGEIVMTNVEWGKGSLKTEEVFIVDVGAAVYAWIGKGASKKERSQGIILANKYVVDNGMPFSTPIVRVLEGNEPAAFTKLF